MECFEQSYLSQHHSLNQGREAADKQCCFVFKDTGNTGDSSVPLHHVAGFWCA